jgi:hypothetical protein
MALDLDGSESDGSDGLGDLMDLLKSGVYLCTLLCAPLPNQ